jgi:amidohydrolase
MFRMLRSRGRQGIGRADDLGSSAGMSLRRPRGETARVAGVTGVLDGDLRAGIRRVAPQLVEWRRHLHMHPEISFEEHETARFVGDVLRALPCVEVRSPTPTSVLGVLRGRAGDGPTIALRADIDALPIQEENDFAFRSTRDGAMHACGHDGHTAMLLGAATFLAATADTLRGEIRFVFQHAEELVPGGALELVDAGVMEGVDLVTGCHLISSLPYGTIAAPAGPCMAASDYFTITINGRGGHGAWPHQTIDPIAVGAQIVSNLQHVVARQTNANDAVVVSVTQFHGGTADNVIPDSVRLGGTARSFDTVIRERTKAAMEQVVQGIAAAHGAQASLDYVFGYDPVVNDAGVADLVAAQAAQVEGVDVTAVEPFMGADDMSYLLQQAPGAYFFVGAGSDESGATFPHHHPRFTIDERALPHGLETLLRTVGAAQA